MIYATPSCSTPRSRLRGDFDVSRVCFLPDAVSQGTDPPAKACRKLARGRTLASPIEAMGRVPADAMKVPACHANLAEIQASHERGLAVSQKAVVMT
jgi:hypothetical protein